MMTQRRALQVLIRHAAANVAGVGCGIRPVLSTEAKEDVSAAVRAMWRRAHGYPMSDSDWFNLRLDPPRSTK